MNDAALKKYLDEDYAKTYKFYDDRASKAKLEYRVLSIYLIVGSAVLTPIVALMPDQGRWRIGAAVLSATLVVVTGLMTHLKSHENWLSYRASWDAMERERRFFETATGPYRTVSDKASLFVERVEGVSTNEGMDFFARHAHAETRTGNADDSGSA